MLSTDNAIDESIQSTVASSTEQMFHGGSPIPDNFMELYQHEQPLGQSISLPRVSSPSEIQPSTPLEPGLLDMESGNSNSSTASNSSISLEVKRPRKSITSSSNKPSLRSNVTPTSKTGN